MQDPIVIVGSGATAVHFALTVLKAGRRVTMLDVGFAPPEVMHPEASFEQLKDRLDDPVLYLLGANYESLVLPNEGSEYYGFPPSKSYVFRGLADYRIAAHGFSPLLSFAAGGLAQAWTAGCYPFTDDELAQFPCPAAELRRAYDEVGRRIGVSGTADDDLAPFFPPHDGLQPPIALSDHSRQLLATYEQARHQLNERRGFYLGHARLASLSRAHEGRSGCTLSGRCLWGCPNEAIYTPSITLDQCRRLPEFTYKSGLLVDHFRYDDANRVTDVVARAVDSGNEVSFKVGTLILTAGTLGSARILLESLLRRGIRHELPGLMDNRQVLMPFLNLRRLGRDVDDRNYQYNQLVIGVPGPHAQDYVHGLVTTLSTAMVHPVVQTLPVGLRTGAFLFRALRSSLGLVNINFADRRRDDNRVTLEPDGKANRLLVSYTPDKNEATVVGHMVRRFRSFLLSLGCFAPPNMTRLRPMGASVHYTGTLPMLQDGGDFTTSRSGYCRPFTNLIVADGSTFPSLPAKNLTFTLMANATRIAQEALGD